MYGNSKTVGSHPEVNPGSLPPIRSTSWDLKPEKQPAVSELAAVMQTFKI